EEPGLSGTEYEADGRRIRVGRGAGTAFGAATAPSPVPAPQAEPAAPAPAGEEALPPGAVTSPMVGTVYAAAEPGAAPLIKVGDSVKEGQTLLIIEAMKVMNPLASPRAGTVTRILVADGQPVEFGELLLVIE
ncbi:MAG: acetyl-CoA carboxylase biotin carboxyl carrier protein, partial [Proteobacteria bacterium]|nr:acetyl-CoA carboxylase biotin carboxyl carrier protein [Pseudomonadota bacterium]